jgi:hypothetical protein
MRGAELPRHNRQHKEEVEAVSILRALLTGVVDYAGLFPPAGLDMAVAVHDYASYRAHDESWMLGRFVSPAARLDDVSAQLRALGANAGSAWRLSALLGTDVEADIERVRAFDREQRGCACVDSLEGKCDSVEAIRRTAAAAGRSFSVFAEIPITSDVESLVGVAKDAGINAKIRTGGVTADAFPPAAAVVRFIRCCLAAQVRFKATAGLHHAVRGDYRLTYAADAPIGPMFGFLNVLLAAGLMKAGLSDADAAQLLDERDLGAFAITPDAIRWRGVALDEEDARSMRDDVMVSFGSCSFLEPVDELRALAHFA